MKLQKKVKCCVPNPDSLKHISLSFLITSLYNYSLYTCLPKRQRSLTEYCTAEDTNLRMSVD